MGTEKVLPDIKTALKPFADLLEKYSYGRLMSIVGIAIIILTIVLPFIPVYNLGKVDINTKTLFIVTGLVLIVCGGIFLYLDKVLIVGFKQKYVLLAKEKNDKQMDEINTLLNNLTTDSEGAQKRDALNKAKAEIEKQLKELPT